MTSAQRSSAWARPRLAGRGIDEQTSKSSTTGFGSDRFVFVAAVDVDVAFASVSTLDASAARRKVGRAKTSPTKNLSSAARSGPSESSAAAGAAAASVEPAVLPELERRFRYVAMRESTRTRMTSGEHQTYSDKTLCDRDDAVRGHAGSEERTPPTHEF